MPDPKTKKWRRDNLNKWKRENAKRTFGDRMYGGKWEEKFPVTEEELRTFEKALPVLLDEVEVSAEAGDWRYDGSRPLGERFMYHAEGQEPQPLSYDMVQEMYNRGLTLMPDGIGALGLGAGSVPTGKWRMVPRRR